MLIYYHVSCFFLYFSFSSHTIDHPNINTAAVFQAMSQQAQKLFGFMKDGASSLIKNVKDTSNRVISRVHEVSHITQIVVLNLNAKYALNYIHVLHVHVKIVDAACMLIDHESSPTPLSPLDILQHTISTFTLPHLHTIVYLDASVYTTTIVTQHSSITLSHSTCYSLLRA